MSQARKSSGRIADKSFFNPVDVHVGMRIRQRRILLGVSQEKLAASIGLTFQQVQKYERGANRVGPSRLFDLCRVLDVQVNYFFDDLPGNMKGKPPSRLMRLAAPPAFDSFVADLMLRRETLELVKAYYKVDKKSARKCVMELIKSFIEEK